MSQLEYYSDPLTHLPHRAALAGWGVVLIVLGSLTALMALAIVAMAIAMSSGFFPNPSRQSGFALLSGAMMYAAVSVALIWLGIGSRLGRRWVRPLMVIGSTLLMFFGFITVASFSMGLLQMAGRPAGVGPPGQPPVNVMLFSYACGGVFTVGLGIVLPGVSLWFYGRRSVQNTLNQMDVKSHWTDWCPMPVLGWTITSVLLGMGLVFASIKQLCPFFTVVLTGVSAVAAGMNLGLVLIVGGILCYRLRTAGWWLTFATFAVLASSMLTFGIWGDHRTYLDLIFRDIPAAQRETARGIMTGSLLSPALMYGTAVAYAVWIRKWFDQTSTRAKAPTVS